jgi:predicted ATPase/DNA-binding CsgD family transcriptional regulator
MMDEPLSDREIEILRLAADGNANAEIAARLSLSLNTVKWYSKRIYEKLAVGNRTEAIRRAQTLGLLDDAREQAGPTQPHHNLPDPLTAFVGRRAEVDAVKQLLKQHRLLTLIGPGGIGKTRLALQVAKEMSGLFRDGIYFVDLSSINEATLVINTIAHVLGVTESLDTPLLALTQAALRDKQLLLVLDNFEHLLEAAPLVADLLVTAHDLNVLVTSRAVLSLYGEQEYAVPPLRLPDLEWLAAGHLAPAALLLNNEALQLFERCAQAVDADFRLTAENVPAVARICLRLDGLPLAIELAAAYIKLLSPQTILMQLDSMWLEMNRSLRNMPARQQTLRNTIEWSYHLLNEEERRLFSQMAVFRGGCTLEAIGEICDSQSAAALLQQLNGLVNKSLVWCRKDGNYQPRFGMLETIRQYALLCLQARGEVETLQKRHALYYTGYTYRVESALMSVKQRLVLNQIEIEVDNFRAALRWALDHDPEPGVRMIGDLGSCWRIRGYLTEGMTWAQQLLTTGSQVSVLAQARAYANTAFLAQFLGHRTQALQMAEKAYLLSHQAADRQTRAQALHARIFALIAPNLSVADYEEIILLASEAARLYTEAEVLPGHARIVNLLGDVYRMQQRFEEARSCYEESVRELRAVGLMSDVVVGLANLGWMAVHMGDKEAAIAYFSEGMDLACELEYPHGIALTLAGAAGTLVHTEYLEPAAQLFGAADTIRKSKGIVIVPSDGPDYESTIVELRAQLGQADFDRCWQKGHTMTVAQATGLVKEIHWPMFNKCATRGHASGMY